MIFGSRALAVLAAACLVAIVLTTAAAESFDWQSREGTIRWAKGLEDGTHVSLDAVIVGKIRAEQNTPYLVVQECFAQQDKLVILTQPDARLRVGQTIDVSGDLVTLDSGDRALIDAHITGYCDEDGNLLLHGPLIKGLFDPIPWDYKVDLSESLQMSRMTLQADEDDPTPPPGDVNTDTSTDVVPCDSVADAVAKDVGTVVELQYHPISSGGTGSFVLADDDDTDTLPVNYTGTVESTDRVAVVRGTIDATDEEGNDKVLDVDSGPNFNEQESYQGMLSTAPQGSIAWVKTFTDGHSFASGVITGKVVTYGSSTDLYIEDDNRSCGIRVFQPSDGHHVGERVDVQGRLGTLSSGERYIRGATSEVPASITTDGSGMVDPLGMNNKTLGGGDFTTNSPTAGQKGVYNGFGLNNIGLLVRTCGIITPVDASSFMIDDGSGVSTKVAYPPYGYAQNDFAVISGISSCEVVNGQMQRVLMPQPFTCSVSSPSSPTKTSPVVFTVTFSEQPESFCADNVVVSGVEGIPTVTGEGTTYNVAVSMPASGNVNISVPSGQVKGNSGVWNYSSTGSEYPVLYDGTPPSLSLIDPTGDTILKAPNATSVELSGLVSDADSGVDSVYIKFDDDDWTTYGVEMDGNGGWSYTWDDPPLNTPTNISFKATDIAGNESKPITRSFQVVNANVLYVKPTGDDANDGLSWDSAKQTITAAINTAISEGEQAIWVAKGTYNESITFSPGFALYGGFADGATSTQNRDFANNETILYGSGSGNVVTASNTSVASALDGFTVRNGMYGVKITSVFALCNCNVCSNSYHGIYITGNGIISGNHIHNNSGDGIYINSTSSVTVSANSVDNNSYSGIYCTGNGTYLVDRNKINHNTSGVFFTSASQVSTIANNFITQNTGSEGGGIYCYASPLQIYNNTIVGNTCSTIGKGSGIYISEVSGQTPYICNNIIANNGNGYGIFQVNSGYTVKLRTNCSSGNGISNYGSNPANLLDYSQDYQHDPGLSLDGYHLLISSYCIDKGTTYWNGSRYYGIEDIDNETRLVGSTVDIGCDESQ